MAYFVVFIIVSTLRFFLADDVVVVLRFVH
jgi:hypothetical protein